MSSDLYSQLVKQGKIKSLGLYDADTIGPEFILNEAIERNDIVFFEQILPLLVEAHYLKENAKAEEVKPTLTDFDSGHDANELSLIYDDYSKRANLWSPSSNLGRVKKGELLKSLERDKVENVADLSYLPNLPALPDHDRGNAPFHELALTLAHLAYRHTVEVVVEGEGDNVTGLMRKLKESLK